MNNEKEIKFYTAMYKEFYDFVKAFLQQKLGKDRHDPL